MNYLTSKDVQTVKQFVDDANKLLGEVSASSLRNNPRRKTLVRQLLVGERISFEASQGSETRSCWIHPEDFLQEHGVEAALRYEYLDENRPGKCFVMKLCLRLRDSTDIAGIAKQCLLKSLSSSQLKLVRESAVHDELNLLAHSQDTTSTPRKSAFEAAMRTANQLERLAQIHFAAMQTGTSLVLITAASHQRYQTCSQRRLSTLVSLAVLVQLAVDYDYGTSSQQAIASREVLFSRKGRILFIHNHSIELIQ